MRLPDRAICPSAIGDAGTVHVAYGDGKDAWYTRYGQTARSRINSNEGTVHSAAERGPRIALADGTICVAWQGDYRQGPHVWFARSVDGGRSFEQQKDLIKGTTPGLDEVAITASGPLVAVFWLDGRGGQDEAAPVTSTIWYSFSADSGETFGPNLQVQAQEKLRACACCSLDAMLMQSGIVRIAYRSGIGNIRDLWTVTGRPGQSKWDLTRISNENWKFQGCPMDGPRMSGDAIVYSISGKSYYKSSPTATQILLGQGNYAGLCRTAGDDLAVWQEDGSLNWRFMKSGASGQLPTGSSRACVTIGPGGVPVIVH